MSETILYPRLRERLDEGTQPGGGAPESENIEEHLPGAINIPLKHLTPRVPATGPPPRGGRLWLGRSVRHEPSGRRRR